MCTRIKTVVALAVAIAASTVAVAFAHVDHNASHTAAGNRAWNACQYIFGSSGPTRCAKIAYLTHVFPPQTAEHTERVYYDAYSYGQPARVCTIWIGSSHNSAGAYSTTFDSSHIQTPCRDYSG